MGWNFDRRDEFLGNTDIVVAHARRRLMEAARALQQGKDPLINATDYRLRGVSVLLPRDVPSWSAAAAEQMDTRPETFRPGL
jgi:hypothetical protein